MNRYTAAGVLADMRNGRRVLVLSETQQIARLALTEVAQGALPGEKVRRANGEEAIYAEHGPGCVLFASDRSLRVRGLTVDIVVFDGADRSWEQFKAIRPALAGSPIGEVIRP